MSPDLFFRNLSSVTLAIVSTVFSQIQVSAHTFDVPMEIVADVNGDFSYDAVLTAGPGDTAPAVAFIDGSDNTTLGVFQVNYYCTPLIPEGESWSIPISGSLTDPFQPGTVTISLALCKGEGLTGTTEISSQSPCSGPTSPIDFGPDFNAPPSDFIILTDQLIDCGVSFSTTDPEGVYWIGGGGYSSFTYCILAGALYNGGDPSGTEPIRMDFTVPVSSVSIRGFDGGGDTETMILEGYSANDVLVDSAQVTAGFGVQGITLTVKGPIAYATVRVEGTVAGLFFDDLAFEEAPISVTPSSWASVKARYR